MKNKILTVLYGVAIFFIILTASIAFPIVFRPFYYAQINTMIIPLYSKTYTWDAAWTYDVIKQGYDEVLDFCCLPWVTEFSAGAFGFTESGASHFADCKVLFMLDFGVFFASLAIAVTLFILQKCKVFTWERFGGRAVWFYSALLAIIIPIVVLGIVAMVGFDKAFEGFHAMFFPGKENWIFNPYKDQIINVMPVEFFMNCAIAIGSALLISSISMIVIGHKTRDKK